MVYDEVIQGRYVELKSATIEDAEFTLAVRQDPEFNRYLPRINNTLEQQKEWISKQRDKAGDYFFVVWDKSGNRIGTISIYDIEGEQAEAGRLTMRGNAFQSIEAQLLSFQFAYNILGLRNVISYIYTENERALRFTQQFGGVIHEPIEKNGNMEYMVTNSKEDFYVCEKKLASLLYRENKR